MGIATTSFRISHEELAILRRKANELGIQQSDLIRLAITSFINKESLIDEVKASHILLAEQIAELSESQSYFREKLKTVLSQILQKLPN